MNDLSVVRTVSGHQWTSTARAYVCLGPNARERALTALRSLAFTSNVIGGLADVATELARADAAEGEKVLVVDGEQHGWLGELGRLTDRHPDLRTLLIADLDTPDEFLTALSAGVDGLCPSDATVEAIERTIRSMVDVGVAIPRNFVAPLVEQLRNGRGHIVHSAAGDLTVTDREWQILQLLMQRRSTREIADALFVSVGTVRSHVSALLHKLGAVDRDDLIGLVERGPTR